MKRRHFLKALGVAAPGALAAAPLAATSAAETPPSGETPRSEPRVFFYDDGRHGSGLYQFEPPLVPDDLNLAVHQLVESGVDTLLYSAGLEGGAIQYNSQVAAIWGDNVDVWAHPIFYRASRNLRSLIAAGHDPMKFHSDRCHEKGLLFFPTCPVGIVGGSKAESIGYGRTSDFAYKNSQFYVGEDDDPRSDNLGRFLGPKRLSFLHAEVRKERFEIFAELLTRYQSDGIELDLSIDNEFGPACRFRDVGQYTELLTEWIGELRAVAEKAEAAQGRRKRIYVRIPSSTPAYWKSIGYDVEAWVSKKLVDGLVCITQHKRETREDRIVFMDQDLDIRPAVELTRGTPCRVLAGLAPYLGRQLANVATAPMSWAAAALAYDRGADGFGFASGMWAPNGWPWTREDYATLRLLGHPDLLASVDKTYLAPSQNSGAGGRKMLRDGRDLLPIALAEGEAIKVPLRIVDDLPHWSRLGRLKSVQLWVRMASFDPSIDRLEVKLNGKPLPDSVRRGSDLHFRVLDNMTVVGPYGFAYNFTLPEEHYPKQGANDVTVRLAKRDSTLASRRELFDVALSIEYLPHRDFQRDPIPF